MEKYGRGRYSRKGSESRSTGSCHWAIRGREEERDGVKMLKFLENHEMRTLKDRSLQSEAQWTWARKCKDKRQRSVLAYIVIEHGDSEETKNIYSWRVWELQVIAGYGQKANKRESEETSG